MDFFQARYYSSVLGRFTSADPGNAGADLTYPQSWNGYAYVSGNPLAAVDPSGNCSIGADGIAHDDDPGDCGGGGTTVDGGAPDPVPVDLYWPNCYAGLGCGINSGGGSSYQLGVTFYGQGTGRTPVQTQSAPAKTGTISQSNCVAGFTAAGAGIGAGVGGFVGAGAGAVGGSGAGAVGGTLVAAGVGTIGGGFAGGIAGEAAGAVGGALVGGGVGAGAGYVVGSIVCANRSGGGGSNFGDNQRQNKQANDARQAAERITGKHFTPAQERKFHDAITGQGLGYHDLVEIAVEVLEGRI